jgi:hypothetical protein
MIIYLASIEPHNIIFMNRVDSQQQTILLSYYDLSCEGLPFRKETFKIIKERKDENQSTRVNQYS